MAELKKFQKELNGDVEEKRRYAEKKYSDSDEETETDEETESEDESDSEEKLYKISVPVSKKKREDRKSVV